MNLSMHTATLPATSEEEQTTRSKLFFQFDLLQAESSRINGKRMLNGRIISLANWTGEDQLLREFYNAAAEDFGLNPIRTVAAKMGLIGPRFDVVVDSKNDQLSTASFTIEDVVEADSGTYACEVSSTACGVVTVPFLLLIPGKQSPV